MKIYNNINMLTQMNPTKFHFEKLFWKFGIRLVLIFNAKLLTGINAKKFNVPNKLGRPRRCTIRGVKIYMSVKSPTGNLVTILFFSPKFFWGGTQKISRIKNVIKPPYICGFHTNTKTKFSNKQTSDFAGNFQFVLLAPRSGLL